MGRRFRSFKRGYRSLRRSPSYRKKAFGISMPFAAGAVAGYTDVDKAIPAEIVLGAATVPMRLGKFKSVAQGMVFGNLVKSLMAKKGFSGAKAGGLL